MNKWMQGLKNAGIAITKILARVGRLIIKHPTALGYIILLAVCAFFPWLAVFLLSCFLCYAYWESGKK